MNKTKKSYFLQIDVLKAFAIISVILLHSLPLQIISQEYPFLKFCIVFTIGQAVPIFFVLMGMNMGASFNRRNYEHLSQIFSKKYFYDRFNRIFFPFLVILGLDLILAWIFKKQIYIGIMTLIGYLPVSGPGNYFISILLQFILVFPFIYLLYRKNPYLMIIICFIIDLTFELLSNNLFVSENYLYSANILRYLFIIALGLYMAKFVFEMDSLKKIFKEKFILIGIFLSILYLILINIFKINYLFLPYWQSQTLFASFYPLFICIIGIIFIPKYSSNIASKISSLIGKASYHIFLIQIIYFGFGFKLTELAFIMGGNKQIIVLLGIIINLVICISLGILFFYIEPKIKDLIINMFNLVFGVKNGKQRS